MTDRDKIHYEAVRRVGNGMKGACFELGAEWALSTVTRIYLNIVKPTITNDYDQPVVN